MKNGFSWEELFCCFVLLCFALRALQTVWSCPVPEVSPSSAAPQAGCIALKSNHKRESEAWPRAGRGRGEQRGRLGVLGWEPEWDEADGGRSRPCRRLRPEHCAATTSEARTSSLRGRRAPLLAQALGDTNRSFLWLLGAALEASETLEALRPRGGVAEALGLLGSCGRKRKSCSSAETGVSQGLNAVSRDEACFVDWFLSNCTLRGSTDLEWNTRASGSPSQGLLYGCTTSFSCA